MGGGYGQSEGTLVFRGSRGQNQGNGPQESDGPQSEQIRRARTDSDAVQGSVSVCLIRALLIFCCHGKEPASGGGRGKKGEKKSFAVRIAGGEGEADLSPEEPEQQKPVAVGSSSGRRQSRSSGCPILFSAFPDKVQWRATEKRVRLVYGGGSALVLHEIPYQAPRALCLEKIFPISPPLSIVPGAAAPLMLTDPRSRRYTIPEHFSGQLEHMHFETVA
jgi:hypothetical protein